mgnify:CR=1 FL=1
MRPGCVLELPTAPSLTATYLAEVVSVQDPAQLGRVQLRLLSFDGIAGQDAAIWARVAVPFAGPDRGAFLLPDVGDEDVERRRADGEGEEGCGHSQTLSLLREAGEGGRAQRGRVGECSAMMTPPRRFAPTLPFQGRD